MIQARLFPKLDAPVVVPESEWFALAPAKDPSAMRSATAKIRRLLSFS